MALAIQDARRYGIDPRVFVRQITQESGFNPSARSSAGAEGIAQFMPGTAAGMHVNPWNPASALAGAARLDAQNLHSFHGNYADMLAAYNAGGGAVTGGYWRSIPQTRNYVSSILGGIKPQPFTGEPLGVGQMPYRGGGVPGLAPQMASNRGNPGNALAALSLIRPVTANLPPLNLPTAQGTLQNLFGEQQPSDAAQAAPSAPSLPGASQYAGELNAIHDQLLS